MLNRRASSRKSQGSDFFMAIKDSHLSELTLRRLHDPIPYSSNIEYATPSDSEHVSVPLIEASGKKGNEKEGGRDYPQCDMRLSNTMLMLAYHYPILF